MGQQQLLLIILGVIIVGIAIAVGLSLFTAQSVQANKDAMINDLNNLAAHAYQFRIRPSSMGGGQGAYTGSGNTYKIPVQMKSNTNAAYAETVTATSVTVVATSAATPTNIITVVIDSAGMLISWTYAGDFL